MGWLIALAVIALVAVIPIGVSARYDEAGPLVKLIAGPVRVTVIPGRKKDKAKKDSGKKEEKSQTTGSTASSTKGGSLTEFLTVLDAIRDFLDDFGRKIRVNRLELKLILAGDDPCDLAVSYGRANAVLGGLVSQLERFFVIKKRDMQVQCDFLADKTLICARIDLTITIGRLFSLGFRHGIRGLRNVINISKLRKGGAVK